MSEKDEVLKTEEAQFWRVCANCTEYARVLANTRGSIGTPEWMEHRIMELVKDQASVKEVRVLNSDKLQELGMNLFYNVGKGADCPPRCVIIHYQGDPSRSDQIDLALVGKGVTFDTGGLNIKKTGFMEDMYGDKGGACAVLGALKGTLELGTKKNIIFACGFAENAIGSSVYKPGDIIKGMKGLSVEIGNTDYEGRLVLADTFTYVQKEFKPKELINLATLTGQCIVALGNDTAGVFSNDDHLLEELKTASKHSFEPIWHLPILKDHKEAIKGDYGDIMNTGKSKYAEASLAAAFLLRFVEEGTKWAHLDIAGPAMAKAAKPPVCAD